MTLGLPSGSTPLDPDEAADLLPTHITTLDQLNEWEAENIFSALEWALQRSHLRITEDFVRTLHLRMFDRTWKWAGQYRSTEKNLGSPPYLIPMQVREACDNAVFWIQNRVFPPTELAVRLHHRMVAVHPFPNGNGRHARLLADIVLRSLDEPELSWGRKNLRGRGTARDEYIAAVKKADSGEFDRLISLARD